MGTRMPMARALIEHGNLDKDHVLFDIQVAYDLVPDIWDLDHLGPVRAPYPEMFVEFALDHERDEITDGLSNAGFFIREHETSKGEIRLSLLFVLQKLDGSPGHTGVYTIFTLTPEGKLANDAEFDWVRVDDNISLPEQDIEMALEFLGQRMIPVALTALSLMNCRNVKTEKLGSVRMRRSGLQKRRGMKPFAGQLQHDHPARRRLAEGGQRGRRPSPRQRAAPSSWAHQDVYRRGSTAGQARRHLVVGLESSRRPRARHRRERLQLGRERDGGGLVTPIIIAAHPKRTELVTRLAEEVKPDAVVWDNDNQGGGVTHLEGLGVARRRRRSRRGCVQGGP